MMIMITTLMMMTMYSVCRRWRQLATCDMLRKHADLREFNMPWPNPTPFVRKHISNSTVSLRLKGQRAPGMRQCSYIIARQDSVPLASGGSKNFEKGKAEDNLSVLVLIYRKCTQRTVCLLHGKKRLCEKKSEPRWGGAPPPPPLNPSLPLAEHNSLRFTFSLTLSLDRIILKQSTWMTMEAVGDQWRYGQIA